MGSDTRNVTIIIHQYVIACIVENAFLKQQHRIVEIIDLTLLDPQQLITLGDRIH